MNIFLIASQWGSDKMSDAWQDVKHPSWTKCLYLDGIPVNLILTENTKVFSQKIKFGLYMEDDPAEKNPSAFFFLLLITPSNLLDLVYPVVEETAVSEKHMEETQGRKICRRHEASLSRT